MIDPAAITATFNSLRFAGDLVKAIVASHDSSVVKEKARELQSAILDAQSHAIDAQTQLAQAIDEIRQLKVQIASLDRWEAEKQRYELVSVKDAEGVFVYQLKADSQAGQPSHSICPKCYESGAASILQTETIVTPQEFVRFLKCPACKTELVTAGHRPVRPK